MKSKRFLAPLLGPLLGTSFLMMGLSMPSCPGQQAMQQQLDALKTSEGDFKTRLSGLEGQLKATRDDLEQTKSMVAQLSKTVMDQASAIEKSDEAIKTLQAAQAKPTRAKKAAKRK